MSVLRERLQLPNSMTFEDYIDVDANLETHAEMTEADLLSEIRPGGTEEEEEEEELNEDADVGVPEARICSLADARNHLQEVRQFF